MGISKISYLFSGRLDLHHIVNLRTLKFITKLNLNPFTPTPTKIYLLYNYNMCNEYVELFKKFNCYMLYDVNLIKRAIYNDFQISITDSI